MSNPLTDPVIARFRAAIADAYGARLERLVLFGSRARGDATEDSDYDFAVFLHGLTDRGNEIGTIVDIETDILSDTGAVINAVPLSARSYERQTIFMGEVRRDGIDL